MTASNHRRLARPYASNHALHFDERTFKPGTFVRGWCGCGETFGAAATNHVNGVLGVGRLHARHLAEVQLLLAN